MKRTFILLIYLLTNLYYSSIVNSQTAVSLTLPELNARVGDTILIPIYTSNFNNVGSSGLKIQFDTLVLHFNSLKNVNPVFDGFVSNNLKDRVIFAWVTTYYPAFIDDGKLMDLSFVYLGGSTNLTFLNDCEIVDSRNLKPYQLILNNGSVKERKNNIEGIVSYDNNISSPLRDAKVELLDSNKDIRQTVRTDVNGNYSFLNVSDGKYIINVSYDYPAKGVNPTDALLINRVFVKLSGFSDDLRKEAGDVNKDKLVNPTDALIINKQFTLIIEHFSAGIWLFKPASVTIIGSDIHYDIKGICFGDVNGSYTP